MKNLIKIPRNYDRKFCYFGSESFGNNSEDANSQDEKLAEIKEASNFEEQIDLALLAASTGTEEMPPSFEKIPASSFLEKEPEELKNLFIVDGKVNFRGNLAAQRIIGLSDLYPKESKKRQFLIVDNKTYEHGARRSDGKVGYGNPDYKNITGGESIEFFVSSKETVSLLKDEKGKQRTIPEMANYKNFVEFSFEELDNLTPKEEKKEKENYKKMVKANEKVAKKYGKEFFGQIPRNFESFSDNLLFEAAQKLEVDLAAVKAIISVESSGQLHASRFEKHIYDDAVSGKYGDGNREMLATSFGGFQIMGFNYNLAGFSSVEEMVSAMQTSEGQLNAFTNFILSNKNMHQALKNHDWAGFAAKYNGPLYYKNNYDKKIAMSYKELKYLNPSYLLDNNYA